ncbi:LysR family transcriptional regulator [Actinoalloteichus hymeniacidonis]|uniref:Transcriptional regulator n=1 Tax=Actinoalloteichus hymeniacidonis TaxID=340345 RepID=A0AAC9HSN3_9PSEU|nr:LysR family transcriptional regulator [Actinoalloteichus hymeniacidonis]AOS64743.1 transcriptional regulator [Actinoalloteichus hymeniacidonis]MBB5907181.1 DNA-binding transcriptional LysR family regulator [Actinoalloteichus hymeniacidonis]
MDLETRHLKLLQIIAEEGSFRRAAQRLGASQPALSRQISRLEKSLGATLLDRAANGVRLTPAGQLVVEASRKVHSEMGSLLTSISALIGRGGSPLRLVASLNPAVTVGRLMADGHPLEIMRHPDAEALEMVERGRADVALVVEDPLSRFQLKESLGMATIMRTPLWLCALPGRPELAVDKVALAGLNNAPWILPESGSSRSIVERLCLAAGYLPDPILIGDDDVVISGLAAGVGIALRGPLFGLATNRDLATRPLEEEALEHKICVWRRDRVAESLVRTVVEALQQQHVALAKRHPEYWRWIQEHPEAIPEYSVSPIQPAGTR